MGQMIRRTPGPRRRAIFMVAALGLLAACGEDADPLGPPPPAPTPEIRKGDTESPGTGAASRPACVSGATRACKIIVSEHEGVVTCFVGVQRCVGESWGPCEDGAYLDLEDGGGDGGGLDA